MLYSLPDIKKLIILSPHPDDEALGCSGTMALLNKHGIIPKIIYITRGERLYGEPSEEIANIRVAEARRACQVLRCGEPLFLNFPDGEVNKYREEIYNRIKEVIDREDPDILLSPSIIDYHQDHIATAKVSISLLNELRSFRLAFYEVYETISFSHLVDISEVIKEKEEAILNYRRSLYDRPEVYVHASLGLNAQRSIFTQKKGYFEAFLIIDAPVDTEGIYDRLLYKVR
jgi:LmbE family N-acetylglucosaminyl deacetylase